MTAYDSRSRAGTNMGKMTPPRQQRSAGTGWLQRAVGFALVAGVALAARAQVTQDFEDPAWDFIAGQTTYTHQGWVLDNGFVWEYPGFPTRRGWLNSQVGAYVRSPLLPEGAVSISFIARNYVAGAIGFEIRISPDGDSWETLHTGSNTSAGSGGSDTHYTFAIERFAGLYVQIRRTDAGASNLRLGLDDIVIAVPPSKESLYASMAVDGNIPRDLRLIEDFVWQGAIDPPAPLVDPTFWLTDGLSLWGDAAAVDGPPIQGTVTADETFALTAVIAEPTLFRLTETNLAYSIRSGVYAPFDGWVDALYAGFDTARTNAAGWVLQAGQVEDDPDQALEGDYAVLRFDGVLASFVRSPTLGSGVGGVGFWYRRAPGATLPGELWIQAFDTGAGDWLTVGQIDAIQNPYYQYAEVIVGNSQASHVRILNVGAGADRAVALDEIFVTRVEADVVLSDPEQDPPAPLLGESVTVRIAAQPVGSATNLQGFLYVRSGTSGPFSAIPMTAIAGGFEGTLPPLPAGTVQYFFEVEFEGPDAVPATWPVNARPAENYLEYVLGSALGVTRFQDFEDAGWDPVSGQTTYENQGWRLHLGFVSIVSGFPSRRAWMNNTVGAYLRSPLLEEGVGTLYFRARNQALGTIAFQIQLSVDGDNWVEVAAGSNSSYGTDGNDTWHRFVLNVYTPVYLRIFRTNHGDGDRVRLGLDDVTVSPPPADVNLAERLRQPGYPSRVDEVRIRTYVLDHTPALPAIGRQVRVHYRPQDASGWTSLPMDPLGGNLYEAVIPPQLPGRVDYYFECEFDGFFYEHPQRVAQSWETENRSPRFLPSTPSHPQPPTDHPHSYEVRPFLSVHNRADALVVPSEASTQMVLIGDNEWEAVIPVSSLTNLTFQLMTQGLYTNNATAFSSTPQIWGDNQQDVFAPPYAGTMDFGGDPLAFFLDHPGFLLVRFNELSGEYVIKRAFFQDFDTWAASPQFFEESLGLFAYQSFEQDFDDWDKDVVSGDQRTIEDFQHPDETEDANYRTDPPVETKKFWIFDRGRRLLERIYEPPVEDEIRNRALQLSNITPGLGAVWNTRSALTEGVDTFSFRYRAALQDQNICAYDGSFTFPDSYLVSAKMRAGAISRGEASLSLFARYVSKDNYYELRVVQDYRAGANNANDDRIRLQIWRRYNGDLEELDLDQSGLTNSQRLDQGNFFTIEFEVEETGSAIALTGRFFDVGGTQRASVTYTDNTSSRIQPPGRIGFLGRDAVMFVNEVEVFDLVGTSLFGDTFVNLNDWDTAGFRADNGQPHWISTADQLTRPVPNQTFYIDIAPTNNASISGPDPLLWQQHAVRTVNSLTWQTTSVTIQHWDRLFVAIRQAPGDCPIVVDDLRLEPWRGRLRAEDDWTATEAWIGGGVKGADDHELLLDRTRANPVAVQALTSPLLTNGMGSISFNYQADGTSVFAVQRTVQGDLSAWVDVVVHTNNTGLREPFYTAIHETFEGRVRVRHLADSSDDTVLRIDDVVVRDYPLTDDPTWRAYNALITAVAPGGVERRMFPVGRPNAQSAFLNDDPADDTPPNVRYDDDLPFIQSPIIETMGIGEISFWYRSWEPLATGEPGTLYIKSALTEDAPPEEWNLVDTVSGITNSTYHYYRKTFYDTENRVVRFYAETNQTQRVALDNILITEPVRSGFEVVEVSIWPEQPLAGDEVYVEARLINHLMNPMNIQVYTLYYVGTNGWGLANWPVTNVVQMTEYDTHRYRTQLAPIPGNVADVDDVVQYVVWATYEGEFASPILQTAFDHPEWYYPVNLNERFDPDWSPYYFVYSCPPGSVWVNEVNYSDYEPAQRDNEYVELVGPAGADIGHWRIELIDPVTLQPFFGGELGVVAPDTVLPEVADGWGFFVWGDAEVPNVDQTFAVPSTDNMPINSGIRLVRSMGAWEDRVAYGGSTASKNMEGYKHIGAKHWLFGGPLHLTGEGNSKTDFTWTMGNDDQFSPGSANDGQTLLPLVPPKPQLDELHVLRFFFTGNQVRIETTGTNEWIATPWFRTNLTQGSWQPVPSYTFEYSGGQFLLLFDRQTQSPVYFYRVEAEPVP